MGGRMTAPQKGDFNGTPASGKTFSVDVYDLIRLSNGKAVEHWVPSDDAGMMAQLGATPAAGK